MALYLAGCTTVRIETVGSDDVQVKQMWGLASIEVKPQSGVLLESTTLGAVRVIDGFALGYHASNLLTLAPGRCQLVVWLSSEQQWRELKKLLRDRTDVCVIKPGFLDKEK